MNQNTQIVFIHRGYSRYLPYAIYQAKSASPNTDIVFIGNKLNFKGIKVEHLDNLYSDEIEEFKAHYAHMSTNSEKFELFCWLRWFHLLNYMRKNKVQSVLHLDSDVMLYSSIEDIKKAYADVPLECALSIPKQDSSSFKWTASGHISFWTIDALEDFCKMILDSYQKKDYLNLYRQKWHWHVAENKPGGICDMTTLYLFWQANTSRVVSLSRSHKGNVFDDNINAASNSEIDQYVTELGRKKVKFVKKRPFFFKEDRKEELDRVHALHLQGDAKSQMKRYYKGKFFPGKAYSDVTYIYGSAKKKFKKLINH
ncbi:hypothetical protein QQ020_19600 [Fulvivirgaceae bacterium BMA12]|uniref:Glycosyltransferase n=1 Tax=Agaribacillus aureus TaxID=3051825 RepID=A0ABT8LDA2_9BACT|nr:hypothetical protein [Fulvivirgaceae bacterium BMA12]